MERSTEEALTKISFSDEDNTSTREARENYNDLTSITERTKDLPLRRAQYERENYLTSATEDSIRATPETMQVDRNVKYMRYVNKPLMDTIEENRREIAELKKENELLQRKRDEDAQKIEALEVRIRNYDDKEMETRLTTKKMDKLCIQNSSEKLDDVIHKMEQISERCSLLENSFQDIIITNSLTKVTQTPGSRMYSDVTRSSSNGNSSFSTKSTSSEIIFDCEEHEERKDGINRRRKNVIIYGMKEEEGLNYDEDEMQVLSFLESINARSRPRKTYRLGVRDKNKVRPVKLVMINEDEKNEVLQKFRLVSSNYSRLYVKDDYSTDERQKIKSYVEEAKKRNSTETTLRWTVRGSPRTKLYLKRIQIIIEDTANIETSNDEQYKDL